MVDTVKVVVGGLVSFTRRHFLVQQASELRPKVMNLALNCVLFLSSHPLRNLRIKDRLSLKNGARPAVKGEEREDALGLTGAEQGVAVVVSVHDDERRRAQDVCA